MRLASRRNAVNLLDGRVRKHFADVGDWRRELNMYRQIPECAPGLLHAVPGVLVLEYLNCPHLLDVLELQERQGFDARPWQAFCGWMEAVHGKTGMVPEDGNLRNFLWDGRKVIGIDFEHYTPGEPCDAAAHFAAFLMEYAPKDTPVKRCAADVLAERWGISEESLLREKQALRRRRSERKKDGLGEDFSMILLAGGKSSRMGRDKAELHFFGSSLLEFQAEKAALLGIDDLMISGNQEGCVHDLLPDRGPLGGLHACLARAKRPHCIVLSVDAPLIPAALLRELSQRHLAGNVQATVVAHDGRIEPLVGVYDAALTRTIPPLIREKGAPVRALLERINLQTVEVSIAENIWKNCNTPVEYAELIRGKRPV